MKIKTDFVTNSSSTSFLLIVKDNLSIDSFLNFLGVEKDSDLYIMAEDLYYNIKNCLEEIDTHITSIGETSTIEDYILSNFSNDALEKYKVAQTHDNKVYVGRLSSDMGDLSSFICCDHFSEESETFYMHYTNCSW